MRRTALSRSPDLADAAFSRGGTALVLSPHLDDAAFSCGGTLALLASRGWRIVPATLFTRSMPDPQGFALACQLDKGLDAAVDYMALRRAEDVVACRALGLSDPVHVPLPEAPHRGYESATALFGRIVPEDDIGPALSEAIRGLVRDHRPDLILAPQAIGGHVDHVQVVVALRGVAVPVLWWRDFPYALRESTPPEPFRERMGVLAEHRVLLDGEAHRAKAAGCLAYASQLGFQFGGPDELRAKLTEGGPIEIFRGQPDVALTA